jgi:hypothetical protein
VRKHKTNKKLDEGIVERFVIEKTCTLDELEEMVDELLGKQLCRRNKR